MAAGGIAGGVAKRGTAQAGGYMIQDLLDGFAAAHPEHLLYIVYTSNFTDCTGPAVSTMWSKAKALASAKANERNKCNATSLPRLSARHKNARRL